MMDMDSDVWLHLDPPKDTRCPGGIMARCETCQATLVCPECRGRLVKHGHDYTSGRQRYLCRVCDRHTVLPLCPGCSPHKAPPSQRRLSESGCRCLDCGSGLIYCPNCGYDTLIFYGRRSWTLSDGAVRYVQMRKCKSCNKITTKPNCNCTAPNMTATALRERDARIEAKPIIAPPPGGVD